MSGVDDRNTSVDSISNDFYIHGRSPEYDSFPDDEYDTDGINDIVLPENPSLGAKHNTLEQAVVNSEHVDYATDENETSATPTQHEQSHQSNGQHYIATLQQMFPALDQAYLVECCQQCDDDQEFETIIMSLVDKPDVQQQTPTSVEERQTEHPFFDIEELPKSNRYLMNLVEMFPNMSKLNLERHCASFGDDVELDTLVTSLTKPQDESPRQDQLAEIESSGDSEDTFHSALNSTPKQHPRFMELVEMFPDIPMNVLERHTENFDENEGLLTMAEAMLKLDLPLPTVNERSEHITQLIDMFPHIDIDVLEKRCEGLNTNEPLDALVVALMAEEEAAVKKSSISIQYQNKLQQLINIFPHVDTKELENVCKAEGADTSLNTLVFSVINSCGLLGAKEDGAAALPPEENLEQLNAYETLLNILTDADPDFLRDKFESFEGDEGALKRFIADALENKNYPTHEEYSKRIGKVRLQRQYRELFNIKNFLEMLPDPFGHFREKTYFANKAVLEQEKAFLKSRFKDIDDNTIDRVYEQEKYSLFRTCKILDCYEGPLADMREDNDYELCYNDIVSKDLLQEIAVIENEEQILKYIKDQDVAKEQALENARKRNELLTCNCCYDESVLLVDMVACTDGHLFCKQCVKSSAEVLIGDGKLVFPCLMDCGKNFTLHTLKVILKPAVFFKMAQRQQLEEVQAANIDELETCPFCDFGAIPLPSDKVFTCLNTDCMQISCRYCKEPNHIPQRCDELPERDEQVKARTQIEDQMTQALVRECYKCKKKFVKTDGCNKMTCSCGAMMCYLCRQPVKDYSHFNGQGGDAHHKCPLWSNNEELHVQAVQDAAARAREEVMAASNNPDFALKYDPTQVLP